MCMGGGSRVDGLNEGCMCVCMYVYWFRGELCEY